MTEHPESSEQVTEEALEEVVAEEVQQLDPEDQLRLELHEANEAKLRALADFKNFQRRSIENETRASQNGIARVVRSILPSIEQMNLAIAHGGDDAVVQGFKIALDELLKGLADCGVSTIQPEQGEEFDPQLHEAMMRQESDGVEADHIVALMQTGFRLGDIILQPAKVSVAG